MKNPYIYIHTHICIPIITNYNQMTTNQFSYNITVAARILTSIVCWQFVSSQVQSSMHCCMIHDEWISEMRLLMLIPLSNNPPNSLVKFTPGHAAFWISYQHTVHCNWVRSSPVHLMDEWLQVGVLLLWWNDQLSQCGCDT